MSSNTWVCLAGGPSLIREDLNFCREQGWNLAVCNLTFREAPDALIFCAGDSNWWEAYYGELVATMRPECQLWTGCYSAAGLPRVNRYQFLPDRGFSRHYGEVCCGGPTGYQLIQLTYWLAPRITDRHPDRIILLGYDNKHGPNGERHHHEDYDESADFTNARNPDRWKRCFEKLAEEAPVEIINASRDTAIECFYRCPVDRIS